MTLYVIGIGGTGAKCIEAMAHLTAVGLLPSNSIEILFVDPDKTNGSLDRTKNTLQIYQNCQSIIKSNQEQCPWMSREIKVNPVWSPFKDKEEQQLKSFFNYNTLKQTDQEGLANLFDVLYTKEEGETQLDVGFRGKPAIGSGIMTDVDLNNLAQEPWRSFIGKIRADAGGGQKTRVLLCGSIFGGTGAAGLPTIGRLIEDKLKNDGVRSSVQVGGLFVLPYFGFQSNPSQNEVHARSELFLLNTEAALRYYAKRSEQYDAIYLLGNQQLSQVEQFSVGKGTQKNRPHFIELYAALAARHFLLNDLGHGSVVTVSRKETGKVGWDDLPEQTKVKPLLVTAARFAHCWLSDIKPELAYCQKVGVPQFQKAAPWFTKFFQGKGLFARGRDLPDLNEPKEQEAIKVISEWCQDYLRWLLDIHQCNNEQIELFKSNYFKQLQKEKFADLVYDDGRDQNIKSKDTVSNLKVKLDGEIEPKKQIAAPNEGVVGLAKAIYMLSKI